MANDLKEMPFYGLSHFEFLADLPVTDDDWKNRLFPNDLSDFINNACCVHNREIFDYYSENKFVKNFGKLNSEHDALVSVFHMNIRSLNCNHRSLLLLLADLHFKFDVIVLSEVWSVNLPFLSNILKGYNFHYNVPEHSSIGGIGVFVRNSIPCVISDLNIESNDSVYVENVWLDMVINDSPFILGAIYRHPNHSVNEFTKALDNQLEKILNSKKSCIIVGDLNIDLIKFQQDNYTSDFINTMLTNNFLPVITMPTRITSKSATLVDHIFVLNSNAKSNPDIFSGNIFSDITDHLPNFVILKYRTKHPTRLQNSLASESTRNPIMTNFIMKSTK